MKCFGQDQYLRGDSSVPIGLYLACLYETLPFPKREDGNIGSHDAKAHRMARAPSANLRLDQTVRGFANALSLIGLGNEQ